MNTYYYGNDTELLTCTPMNYRIDESIKINSNQSERETLKCLIARLQPEDLVITGCLDNFGKTHREIINTLSGILSRQSYFVIIKENIDSSLPESASLVKLILSMDRICNKSRKESIQRGIDLAKVEGKFVGRKPISVDNNFFEEVVSLWEKGSISAKDAMHQLKLKPNTFYRRVKERNRIMKNQEEIIKAAKALGKEVKKGLDENMDDLKDIIEDIKEDYKNGSLADKLQKEYADKKDILEYYYDNAKDDVKRELQEIKDFIDLKSEVKKETKDFKNK